MISIKTIGKKKSYSDGTSSKSVSGGFANNTTTTVITQEVHGVNIWGQYHDHSGDVDGDMLVNGNITTSADIIADGDVNCSELIATNVVSDEATTNRTTTNSIVVNSNATVSGTLNSHNANISNLNATEVSSENITTEYLTVTKQAHFFNLTIDEIKSVGGQIILSAANATVDHVEQSSGQYVLCWKKDDGEDGISNQFKVNDQIICQTFNKTDAEGQNITNKYYWALVTMVGEGSYIVDDIETECNYIVLSPNDYDGTLAPEVGDKICQLGYRDTNDNARQSAIILSAYKSPDVNVTAPSIVQYAGINSYSLDGCIVNQMSPTENIFTGEFKVISNGTTTDVVDLIQGQHPQVITDSEQSWIMADSNGKTYYQTDYQNLPTIVQAYLGSEVIPYSEWATGSQIKFKNKTYKLTGTAPVVATLSGLCIDSVTRNTNDCTLSWKYEANLTVDSNTGISTNNGTNESNSTMEITIVFTHNGTTYTVSKNVPFNMIKASAVTQGADAEFDKLMIDKLDLTVTLNNQLTCNVDAKVYHIKGSSITQVTDLTDYTANLTLSNNQTVTLSKSTYFYRTSNISNAYSSMTNPPTSAILKLMKNGTLVDEVATAIKFDAGSIFTITDNAISAAVQQSNGYTDNKVAQVQLTADGISSRVTVIENDYVTSSELTQTANNIQLNVYDELKNKTGIDVSAGQITLNGNTLVNGNLTISESEQGFTLIGESGITQIMPKSIGTYNEFTSLSSTTIEKVGKTYGIELNETEELVRFKFVTDFILKNIKQGTTITISPKSRDYYTFSNVNIHHYTEISKVISFLEEGVSKKSQAWTTDAVDYTAQGNTITIRTTDTVDIPTYFFNDDHEINAPWQWIKINVTIPNESFMLVGYDGMAVNFGTSATAYFGAESATVKYGDYGLQISEQGLKKWNGSNWVGINSKKVITMTTDTTLTNDDDLIVYNSSTQRTLTLPNNLEVGKTVYIKKLGSTNLKLQSSTSNIYIQNSTSGTASTTVSTFVFLIWDGSHWLLGYVG